MFWSDGYRTDIEYTYGYYKNLSPTFQKFVALVHGAEVDIEEDNSDKHHIELGFGQGVSLNFHAASHLGKFIGNDFNPSHVVFANKLSQASGANIRITDDSFEEFLQQADIPLCDSISIHGVWSWVTAENREYIAQITQKFLKPGGIFYISYNCSAGHGHFIDWKNQLYDYYQQQTGSPQEKAQKTFEYFDQLFEEIPSFFEQNSLLKRSWEMIKKQIQKGNYSYLIHEYLNQSWSPTSFMEMNKALQNSKLSYIGSCNFNNILNNYSFDKRNLDFLNSYNIIDREQWRDLISLNTFRQDIFMKGHYHLSEKEYLDRLKKIHFIPLVPRETLKNTILSNNTMTIKDELFKAVSDGIYADNMRAKSFDELLKALPSEFNFRNLLHVLVAKVHSNEFAVVKSLKPDSTVIKQCHDINYYVFDQLFPVHNIAYLTSPILGLSLPLSITAIVYLVIKKAHPKMDNKALAEKIFDALDTRNIYFKKDNSTDRCDKAESIERLLSKHIPDIEKSYPIFKQLQFF